MAARKKTVLFVTGTRAEWGLMQSTITRLQKTRGIDVKVLVTGMHTQKRYGDTIKDVRKVIRVAHTVRVGERDDQLTALSKEIDGIGKYLTKHPVDAVLVVGDRDEPFAASIAAMHRGIPIIHIAGGDVTGPTVDQYQRDAMTLFSGLHLVQTKRSAKNVKKLGADPRSVKIVGAPGLDNLRARDLPSRTDLAKMYDLNPEKKWFLVVMHPTILDDTPIKKQIQSVMTALDTLDRTDEKIILYPNADDGTNEFIAAIEKVQEKKHFHVHRHFPRPHYLGLMKQSAALIGNTSSGLMEAGYLKTPFICVGHRQQHREHGGNVLFVDYDSSAITKAIRRVFSPLFRSTRRFPYRGGAVSECIVREIENFLHSL